MTKKVVTPRQLAPTPPPKNPLVARTLPAYGAQSLIRRYRRRFPNSLLSAHLALDADPTEDDDAVNNEGGN